MNFNVLKSLGICSQVSICDLDSDAGELTAKELEHEFGANRVLFCHCDVTDYIQFEGKQIKSPRLWPYWKKKLNPTVTDLEHPV